MAGTLTRMIGDPIADPTNTKFVRSLCDLDITYVSLTFHTPDLKRITPSEGTAHVLKR